MYYEVILKYIQLWMDVHTQQYLPQACKCRADFNTCVVGGDVEGLKEEYFEISWLYLKSKEHSTALACVLVQ